MSEWIDASKNPPPKDEGKLIVIRKEKFYFSEHEIIVRCVRGEWFAGDSIYHNFDYWMPWDPPKLPKKNHYCFLKNHNSEVTKECYEEFGLLYFEYMDGKRYKCEVSFCPICGKGVD